MSDVRPVGVFDSGVGGLSILAEIHRQLPTEPVVYVADQAWAPYGERSLEEVRARSFVIVEHLLGRGVSAIVVACNTASAAALHELRAAYAGIPFVGMEPAVKPAAERTNRGVVGVLATTATFQGELYASVVDRHANGVRVVERAGSGLVELIEAGHTDGEAIEAALRTHLAPMTEAEVDTLVLGCTHYPFVRASIERILGDGVHVIDPAPAVARQLARVLAVGVRSRRGPTAETTYLTTGDDGRFAGQVRRLLGVDISPRHIVL